ncbi:DUF4180 domain-containing protein [Membranihabitans maritimus]|uniref:DUF4180 domain-containing protein n=1 Tax=Membranihabitans maritimus TaxID=2904244 RepID=UPI001F1618AF|nr:DUF4180 domain-containing protein [Membranihabitans maritimus]
MKIDAYRKGNVKIAVITSDGHIIESVEDGVDLMGNIYYQGYDKVVLYEENITPRFFDLKTKMAGEILQKFSTYRIRLSIIGTFSRSNSSKSLKDFIHESNKMGQVNFVPALEEALEGAERV